MTDERDDARRRLLLPPEASAAPEVGVWLAALADARARTHAELAEIGQPELDWVDSHDTNTIGTLLYHVAAIELDWLHSEILEQPFPDDFRDWFPHDVRDSAGKLETVSGESAKRHTARLRYVRTRLVEALSTMSIAEFRRVRHLEEYDASPEWVVHHLLQHEAQHRGQVAILRRRFRGGGVPPSG